MNMAISFFVGCITFVVMLFVKLPIKKINYKLASRVIDNETEKKRLYKKLNVIIIFIAMMLSMIFYYIVLRMLGGTHFKMCCSVKAGAIAVALYMIFEQWFGDDFRI